MKVILFIVVLLFNGCATPIRNLKPSIIYLLEDKHKITIYRTHNENIYIINDNVTITTKE
jgi:hypothetical protein